jgi:hypothetical protein
MGVIARKALDYSVFAAPIHWNLHGLGIQVGLIIREPESPQAGQG